MAATVRDILVTKPDLAGYRWMVETCLAHYDRVLVHGDERLMPFAASFPLAAELGVRASRTRASSTSVRPRRQRARRQPS